MSERAVLPAKVLEIMAEMPWFKNERTEEILDLAGEAAEGISERPHVDKKAEKSVASPPYMQVPLEDVHVRCGEMAKFQATIEGNPQPVIGWFKGISLLLDSERICQSNEGTSYSLILYNAQAEDGGVYTCMAKNAGGEVVCKAELVVQEGILSFSPAPRLKVYGGSQSPREVQRPPQDQADLMSFFEAEKYELYHHLPSPPGEVLKGQTPAVAGYSQAKMRLFGTSGEKVPITLKKRPYSIGEGRSQNHQPYRDTEAHVLENLAEEMAYLSKATPLWPESGPVSPQDPSEADIIYPGEEDYFSLQSYLSKKARMSSPDEGQGLDYPGSS
ncbi:myosin light chain kinase, smooth muscle-like [Vipera latastei]